MTLLTGILDEAVKSSPITSGMQEVKTAIIFGLYRATAFSRPSCRLFWPPNTAPSSVIASDTAGAGSRK